MVQLRDAWTDFALFPAAGNIGAGEEIADLLPASAIFQASPPRVPRTRVIRLASALRRALRRADGTARLAEHDRPVGPVGATLHVHGVRRAQRPVGGELEGRAWSGLGFGFGCGCGCGLGLELEARAVDEGAVGEDDLVRGRGR